MPLLAKSDGRREPTNAASCDQYPQGICRRSHRRSNDQDQQLAILPEVRDVRERAFVLFPLGTVDAFLSSFQAAKGGESVGCPVRR